MSLKKGLILGLVMAFSTVGTGYAAKYKVAPVSNGGSLSGKLTFKGTVPTPDEIKVAKDPNACGRANRIIQEVVVNKGALTNAIVYIENVASGKDFEIPAEGYQLVQDKCDFLPHLLTMKQKGSVTVSSKDSVAHNIHTYEIMGHVKRTLFNQAQPNQGFTFEQKIRLRRSNIVKVECDIHNFMHSWMFVANNPYFAKVGADGTFEIKDIPPGSYKLKAWNPKLGELTQDFKIAAGGKAEVNFEFKN